MKRFNLIFIIFIFSSLISACSSNKKINNHEIYSCPKCNMKVFNLSKHSAKLIVGKDTKCFDDIGCMILWLSDNNIDIINSIILVLSNDTNEYLEAKSLVYTINEITPMSYGFTGYKNKINNSITFNEVILKMLRGEHMANPKIKKHILGI